MIIRLIKNIKISQYLQQIPISNIRLNQQKEQKAIHVPKFNNNGHNKTIYFNFGNSKDRQSDQSTKESANQNLSNSDKKPEPKIIQITKQQYLGMKKFLQDITLSMPTPNFSPPSSNTSYNSPINKQSESPSAPDSIKQATSLDTQIGTQYFSSPEQKLSFQLLKLNKPQQFLPIFKQYRETNDVNIKLIIIHRYCSIGGNVSTHGGQTSSLAYKYMGDVLKNMKVLQQNQLQLFLQLYISLYQQMSNKKQKNPQNIQKFSIKSQNQHNQSQLPKLTFSKDQLALIQSPSHTNSRLIVLLLQFYQIQAQSSLKQSKQMKQIVTTVLEHYQLRNAQGSNQQEIQQKQHRQVSQIKNLAYIGLIAYMYDLQNYNAIPKLIRLINQKHGQNSMTENINKQLIRASQQILQNIHKLNNCTSHIILNNTKLLEQSINNFIIRSLKESLSTSIDAQAEEMLEGDLYSTSATVQSLLYTSLLVLQQNKNNISKQWSLSIISTILKNYKDKKEQKVDITQLGELWKSCSIMYKLTSKQKYIRSKKELVISNEKILSFVECFINKTIIHQQVKAIINPNNNSVIEEYALNLQTILFQSLVAYRMVLPSQIKVLSPQQLPNLNKEVADQNDPAFRKVLIDLLTGYRKVTESLYLCGLINSSHQIEIHNLLIACMIAEAYPLTKGPLGGQKMIKYLLSPTVLQILKQLGISNAKYGNYGKKIIEKYN